MWESENDIMRLIEQLAETKTVVLITHRLANVVRGGPHTGDGGWPDHGVWDTCGAAAGKRETFTRLWHAQQELENYGKEDTHAE